MDQKEIMEKLKQNPALLQSVMQSSDGQQLMRLLTGGDGGSQLNQATKQAAAGNTAQILQMLRQITASPEGSALIQRISQQLTK